MSTKAPERRLSQIKFATIHHSAEMGVNNATEAKRRASIYNSYHASKSYALETGGEYGFKYISYHYLIARNGYVLKTQHLKYVRYHATDNFRGAGSHNLWGIAVLLDGNFEKETPTSAQLEAAARVIANFNKANNIKLEIKGHKEQSMTGTLCPGKNMGLSTSSNSNLRRIIRRVNQLSGFISQPRQTGGIVINFAYIIRFLRKLFGIT